MQFYGALMARGCVIARRGLQGYRSGLDMFELKHV